MDKQNKLVSSTLLFIFFSVLLTGSHVVEGTSSEHHHRNHDDCKHRSSRNVQLSKLFVFGDSYVDTGNNKIAFARSWKIPYGITFPGKPSGRYSNGRVFTDFVALYMGIKSPIPYRWRKIGTNLLKHGMNFAYGGTGVFDTMVPQPNMTTQINFFRQLLIDGVYTKSDLDTSMALVTVAGNDYGTYNAKNGTAEGLPAYITTVVNQLCLNLKQIQSLGVKKVVVTALEPLGCLPGSTAISSYQKCNGTQNIAMGFHNLLLQQTVQKLNNETIGSPFVILDFYSAFMSVFNKQGTHPDSLKFENPLKPCCLGISPEYTCGSVNEKGEKKYTICENPDSAFFWDGVHPSQRGWNAVFSALQPSLLTGLCLTLHGVPTSLFLKFIMFK